MHICLWHFLCFNLMRSKKSFNSLLLASSSCESLKFQDTSLHIWTIEFTLHFWNCLSKFITNYSTVVPLLLGYEKNVFYLFTILSSFSTGQRFCMANTCYRRRPVFFSRSVFSNSLKKIYCMVDRARTCTMSASQMRRAANCPTTMYLLVFPSCH